MSSAPLRLRPDLPFRRIALVLSGGGALGAYEAGVLRTLEQAGVRPFTVAGVSIGAVNAAVWVANGFRSAPLEDAWRRMDAASIGLRWITLAWRALGAAAVLLALVQLALILTGSRELSGAYWLWGKSSGRMDLLSTLLEASAWLAVGLLGVAALIAARPAERWFARANALDARRAHRTLGTILLVLLAAHLVVWVFGWPWPHRFSALLLIVGGLTWLANRPGRAGAGLRGLLKRLMPETQGRGLWTGAARRRVIERLLPPGDAARAVAGPVRLVVSALAVDSGRVCHFVAGPDPGPGFAARVAHELGEVRPIRDAEDLTRAVIASSAIPGVFEPVRIGGRDFVDAGGFTNQPLHIALADEADAALVVLLTPSDAPPTSPEPQDLLELGSRLLEIANWRDMQSELRNLPPGWSRDGAPARLVVIEPAAPLPGGVLGFDAKLAPGLIERGAADARAALERAGWLDPGAGGAPA